MKKSSKYAGTLTYADDIKTFLEVAGRLRAFHFEDKTKSISDVEEYINSKLNDRYVVLKFSRDNKYSDAFVVSSDTISQFNTFFKDIKNQIPDNPTRQFEIGQNLRFGNVQCVVLNKYEGGKYYLVKNTVEVKRKETAGKPDHTTYYQYRSWVDLYDDSVVKNTNFHSTINDFNLNFIRTTVGGLLFKLYHWPVDMNPYYQRGYVWTMEDKIKLIHSIFNNVDIQKFSFVECSYQKYERTGYMYEILDGKQRLNTLQEFFEDRWEYEGCKFSELSQFDKNHFENFSVSSSELKTDNEEEILSAFVHLNTAGKRMDDSHLDKIRKMLKEGIVK